jgi:hypothetical protein
MNKPRILVETDPDLARAGEALERVARDARRLADETDTQFIVFIDGKNVDLCRLEQEAQVASTVNEPSEPYPTR